MISRGFGGIRGDSGEVLKHWAVDAEPKARENNLKWSYSDVLPERCSRGNLAII